MLSSGNSPNSVPARATLVFDRRLVPGESIDSAKQEIFDLIQSLHEEIGDDFKCDYEELYSVNPVWVPEDQPIVHALAKSIHHVLGIEPGYVSSPGSDDQVIAVFLVIEYLTPCIAICGKPRRATCLRSLWSREYPSCPCRC